MRDYRPLYFKVGFFVLISILILLIGIFVISGEQKLFERRYTVKTYFDNTAGLLPGAYVRLSGVKIGTVSKISFPQKVRKNLIEVRMEVDEEGIKRITPDSKATIRTEGLLGAKYIEIVRGELPPHSKIPEEVVIESYTPPELQEIIGQSEQFLTNIISISENLDMLLKGFSDEENLQNLSETVKSVRSSSEALQRNLDAIENGQGTIHSLIYSKKIANDLNSAVSNLNNATAKLNGEDGLIANLNSTASNLKEITDMLKGGEGTLGALLIDPSVYDSLKGVLGEAERSRLIRAAVRYIIEEKSNEDTVIKKQ